MTRFCTKCGAPISAPVARPVPLALLALVAVLFLAVGGFIAILVHDHSDPDPVTTTTTSTVSAPATGA